MSQLRKYNPNPSHILELKYTQLKDDLTFHVSPAQIMDQGVKQLTNKSMQLIKVAWGRDKVEEYTWEQESNLRINYLKLFIGNEFCGQIFF